MTVRNYDPKCDEIAEHFLPDSASPRLVEALGQHIQDAIEDWLESEARRIGLELGTEAR